MGHSLAILLLLSCNDVPPTEGTESKEECCDTGEQRVRCGGNILNKGTECSCCGGEDKGFRPVAMVSPPLRRLKAAGYMANLISSTRSQGCKGLVPAEGTERSKRGRIKSVKTSIVKVWPQLRELKVRSSGSDGSGARGCKGLVPAEGTESIERVSACTSVRGCRDILPDEGTERAVTARSCIVITICRDILPDEGTER